MSEHRGECCMRHENGNCLPIGGFCTAVNDEICEALHNAFGSGFSFLAERIQQGAKLKCDKELVNPMSEWISVKDRLPAPEQEVLIACETIPNKFKYICTGFYIPEKWLRQESEYNWDWEACDEYCEEEDDFFVNKGWYEYVHNWDEYGAVGVIDNVTHWMPLPEPPKED